MPPDGRSANCCQSGHNARPDSPAVTPVSRPKGYASSYGRACPDGATNRRSNLFFRFSACLLLLIHAAIRPADGNMVRSSSRMESKIFTSRVWNLHAQTPCYNEEQAGAD
jgi:hypothetical protein